jgi:HTH-type transcriptional regulator / antitoxin HigA
MTAPRLIRSTTEYKGAKDELGRLMSSKQTKQTAQEIEYLSLLIEAWEREHFPVNLASPIDAIKFRLDQKGLTLRDLEPLLGSRSRVSEIMSGKRPLSIEMVRALHTHLAIPSDVLIRKPDTKPIPRLALTASLKKLLVKRSLLKSDETLVDLVARAGSERALPAPLYRRELTERANARTNTTALLAWTASVLIEANKLSLTPFKPTNLSNAALVSIARISRVENWAAEIKRYLSNLGIALVIMPHLPETYVDGASLRRKDRAPVIALTLRYNRIDNFWFVLLHELIHVARHFIDDDVAFFDDLDIEGTDEREREADQHAQDALTPPALWRELSTRPYITAQDIEDVAARAGVHPAIVAGRVRRETGDYRRHSSLVGNGEVRKRFPEYGKLADDQF